MDKSHFEDKAMETQMSAQIPAERFKKALMRCLDETFSEVKGIYLDEGTTLYETLDGMSAEEASQRISSNSATIAAQVEHIRFYLDVLDDYMRTGIEKTNNWREIWERVSTVTPDEWKDMKRRLHESHERVLATINSFETWEGKYDIAGAMSVLVHTAYHLGGIRQALGAIRAGVRA
jgi:DinB family protein